MSDDVLKQLSEILSARKSAAADDSYVASLYQQGLNKILEKVGEESVETLLAAKDAEHSGDNTKVIYETADLWFHSLVMLSHLGEDASSVLTSWKNVSICLALKKRLNVILINQWEKDHGFWMARTTNHFSHSGANFRHQKAT